jgi:hypothetical protein
MRCLQIIFGVVADLDKNEIMQTHIAAAICGHY